MDVQIVEEHGTHLLIRNGDRYAVVERRDGRLYNCHDGQRTGVSTESLDSAGLILDERDWTARDAANATFQAVTSRGTELAQRML